MTYIAANLSRLLEFDIISVQNIAGYILSCFSIPITLIAILAHSCGLGITTFQLMFYFKFYCTRMCSRSKPYVYLEENVRLEFLTVFRGSGRLYVL